MDNCPHKSTCNNYNIRCYQCCASSDIYNHYPCFEKKRSDIEIMNNRALYASQEVYDLLVNSPNGVPVCTVDRDLIYIKAIGKDKSDV